MSKGPYLFDVGVTALAHSDAPVREAALSYVRDAITGDIDAVVPYSSVLGAHHVLTGYYELSTVEASRRLGNFIGAERVHWYSSVDESAVRQGLMLAHANNIGAWDGYYATVARSEGIETVLTVDDDFNRVTGLTAEVILTDEEFAELNEYLGY